VRLPNRAWLSYSSRPMYVFVAQNRERERERLLDSFLNEWMQAPQLQLYVQYMSNFRKAVRTLSACVERHRDLADSLYVREFLLSLSLSHSSGSTVN